MESDAGLKHSLLQVLPETFVRRQDLLWQTGSWLCEGTDGRDPLRMGTDLGKEALLEGSREPARDPYCTWKALAEDTPFPYVEKA